MNKLEIKGDWNSTQKRTGETREAAEKAIEAFSSACGCK